jgi:NADH-quinone oxidoreductase subunit N
MSWAAILALLPIIVLAAAAIAALLAAAFRPDHRVMAGCSIGGMALSFAALFAAHATAPQPATALIMVDGFALLFGGLILLAGLAVAVMAVPWLERRRGRSAEFHVLLLLAVTGAVVLAAASHFLSFVLGLELLSVALLALIAYPRLETRPLEAGLKYLVMAGVSTAALLFGLALLYAATGSMTFDALAGPWPDATPDRAFLVGGFALAIVSAGFKLSLVPFHMWAPDVYDGAPAPVSALIGTVSKGAVLALLLRLFDGAEAFGLGAPWWTLAAMAVASMLAGNLLALRQRNVKRLLAYSSIAHFGYVLVAVLAGGAFAVEAVAVYLAGYFVTLIGAFAVVALLPDRGEAIDYEDYRGLFWRRPWVAAAFAAMLLSLAGIPLTLGFIAKVYAFAAGVELASAVLLAALVVGSMIGLYYYLRLAIALFAAPEAEAESPAAPLPATGAGLLAALTAALILLGIYPGPLIAAARAVAEMAS